MARTMTFEKWMKAVDGWAWKLAGCSIHDLVDRPIRDWYEDGVSAKAAAKRAIRYSS